MLFNAYLKVLHELSEQSWVLGRFLDTLQTHLQVSHGVGLLLSGYQGEANDGGNDGLEELHDDQSVCGKELMQLCRKQGTEMYAISPTFGYLVEERPVSRGIAGKTPGQVSFYRPS